MVFQTHIGRSMMPGKNPKKNLALTNRVTPLVLLPGADGDKSGLSGDGRIRNRGGLAQNLADILIAGAHPAFAFMSMSLKNNSTEPFLSESYRDITDCAILAALEAAGNRLGVRKVAIKSLIPLEMASAIIALS